MGKDEFVSEEDEGDAKGFIRILGTNTKVIYLHQVVIYQSLYYEHTHQQQINHKNKR